MATGGMLEAAHSFGQIWMHNRSTLRPVFAGALKGGESSFEVKVLRLCSRILS